MGLITPAGRSVQANWRAVAGGVSALSEGPAADLPAWARWAGRVGEIECPNNLPGHLRGQLRFLNRGALLALIAADDAITQAAPPESMASDRRSLYLATGDLTTADCRGLAPAMRSATRGPGGALDSEKLNRNAIDRVNPFFLLSTLANNPFSIVTAAFGLTGPGTTLASHSPNGNQALDLAFRSIRHNRTDLAVVVASGSWLDLVPIMEMAGIGLLSRCRHGELSFRPLDSRRDGFIAGEGGAALVLELASAAQERGARILGEIETSSNCRETSPNLAPGNCVTLRCMQQALAEADLQPGDIGFINVHGSGTRKGDQAELRSVAELCREAGTSAPLCALKPHTGHMGAAGDLYGVIIGIEAARRGKVPATLNFSTPDPEFAEARIAPTQRVCSGRRFLSVSYGLGGQSSAVVARASRLGDHD